VDENRRGLLTIASASLILAACQKDKPADAAPPATASARNPSTPSPAPAKDKEGEEVGATEDLMREHGVIRRVLVVYRESAIRLRAKKAVAPDALQKAAKLIRTFAEDYHERQLEETHLFPVVKKAGGVAAGHIDTLIAQHKRGREITEYLLAATQKTIGVATAEPLARVLESFAGMYEAHAAHEDTVLFPAWKKVLSPKQLDEMGDLFEDIEHKVFGKDGFDDAVEQVAAIEKSLGLDLAMMTAPPPPQP
jgi:hemerythrin-like domain-containing protein